MDVIFIDFNNFLIIWNSLSYLNKIKLIRDFFCSKNSQILEDFFVGLEKYFPVDGFIDYLFNKKYLREKNNGTYANNGKYSFLDFYYVVKNSEKYFTFFKFY